MTYKAICGNIGSTGLTPGQALDLMETSLNTESESRGETLVILQRFHADDLLTKQQQERLQNLASETEFSPLNQQELTALVEAELEASIQRGTRIIKKTEDHS